LNVGVIAADGGLTLTQLITLTAVYSAQIRHLKVFTTPYVEHSADSIEFNFTAFGPYLAAFTSLRTLHLGGFNLNPGETAHWPQPNWHLTSLCLYPDPEEQALASTDLDWFTSTSRASLRHLSLGLCGQDALNDLATWGDALVDLGLFYCSDEVEVALLLKLAQMRALERLELLNGDIEGGETDRVTAEVNRRLGKEVVVVV
jgi:hypothetical protein